MSRRDLAADLDRPHFYSQFWIDVAMGKRDTSVAVVTEVEAELEPDMLDELDEAELEPVVKAPAPARKPAKPPEKKPEPARPAITSLADLANIDLLMRSSAEMEGDEVPDIETGPASDLAPIVTDFDVADVAAEPEAAAEEENLGEGDFDEEEEEDEWGSRRKPSKPQKQERRRERPERGRPF